MFGGGQKATVDRRAKRLARIVAFIVHGLQTKSYEQFIASFSNPGSEPNAFDRSSRDHRFQMRISPTCWYDAFASYPLGESPSILHSRRRRRLRCLHRCGHAKRHHGRPAPRARSESGPRRRGDGAQPAGHARLHELRRDRTVARNWQAVSLLRQFLIDALLGEGRRYRGFWHPGRFSPPGNHSIQIRHHIVHVDAAKKGATLWRPPKSRVTLTSVPNRNSNAPKASLVRPRAENA